MAAIKSYKSYRTFFESPPTGNSCEPLDTRATLKKKTTHLAHLLRQYDSDIDMNMYLRHQNGWAPQQPPTFMQSKKRYTATAVVSLILGTFGLVRLQAQ